MANRGVLDGERAAIATYTQLARAADGSDHVSRDLVVEILAGEEDHRRFESFVREFRSAG